MCDYLRSHDLSVHSVAMQPNADVSLPPFAGALSLLETDPTLANVDLEAVDAATPTMTTRPMTSRKAATCSARWRSPHGS